MGRVLRVLIRALSSWAILVAVGAFWTIGSPAYGQGGAQVRVQENNTPATARATAPFDPTGYWVSVITQNWRLRMVPPRKGDYIGIPISVAGKKVADQWDLARDEARNDQCASYGPPTIMNQPTRLRISWQDDSTLRIDTDYGTQTRVFSFGQTPTQGRRTRQGTSVAVWEARRGRGAMTARYLKVTTANMLPGYLRKNGVPYGERATLTEYFDIFNEPQGAMLMVVTAVVTDPVYLEHPFIVASQFKKEADSSKWDPTACSAGW